MDLFFDLIIDASCYNFKLHYNRSLFCAPITCAILAFAVVQSTYLKPAPCDTLFLFHSPELLPDYR